jgi:hypothetical protein
MDFLVRGLDCNKDMVPYRVAFAKNGLPYPISKKSD